MKYCCDCEYFRPETIFPDNERMMRFAKCMHPSALSPKSLVHPAVIPQERSLCSVHRMSTGNNGCGPDAQHFVWMDQSREPPEHSVTDADDTPALLKVQAQ